jgi:hypothetical protein
VKTGISLLLASILTVGAIGTGSASGSVEVAPQFTPPTPGSVNPAPYPGTIVPRRQLPPPPVVRPPAPRNRERFEHFQDNRGARGTFRENKDGSYGTWQGTR